MLRRSLSRSLGTLLVSLFGYMSMHAQMPQISDPVLDMPVYQKSKPRRVWSLSAGLGANNLFSVKRNDQIRKENWEQSGSIGVEVFLPRTNLSLFGHLTGEALNAWDINYEVGGIEFGSRYYLRPASIISPYVGISGIWTFQHSGAIGDTSQSDQRTSWIQTGDLSRVTLSPSVGLDLKLFSYLSITAEYNSRLPIGSSLRFIGTESGTHKGINLKTNGLRHSLMIGIKVNFLKNRDNTEGIVTVFDWLYNIFGGGTTR